MERSSRLEQHHFSGGKLFDSTRINGGTAALDSSREEKEGTCGRPGELPWMAYNSGSRAHVPLAPAACGSGEPRALAEAGEID